MDNFLTIILAITGIFGIFKIVNEITLTRSSKHRDDYAFTKNYLDDLNNPKTHGFVIQKGFRALTNNIYPVEEIKILLSHDDSMETIYLRSASKKTLHFNKKKQQYEWVGIYKKEWFRKIASKLLILAYAITSFSALMPFLLKNESNPLDTKGIILSISLGMFAVLAVIKQTDFVDSLKFMNMMNQKTINPVEE
ncbi:hypothetical protein E8Q33_05280 [Methylophaga sp. SB9B]|uniref:hypothetical protein n=1 Tax=Methylophaga sp. SB9B TaxID=2570356 RepID=UPI0010A89B0F|nr:hypothetical protein [Methylophaga sp. SB9B]THK42192.1 hypothetical protein E8Q33_05280 [Methylophaga sp. SB9B]